MYAKSFEIHRREDRRDGDVSGSHLGLADVGGLLVGAFDLWMVDVRCSRAFGVLSGDSWRGAGE